MPPGRRNFSLKSVRIPAKKLLASGPKSLAAGHIANFQTSPRACLKKSQHAQPAGLLPPGRRNFSLQSARIPAKKLLASGPKSLAAGHIANFQTSPSTPHGSLCAPLERSSSISIFDIMGPIMIGTGPTQFQYFGRKASPPTCALFGEYYNIL